MAMPAPRLISSDSWLENVGDSFSRALLREELSAKTVRSYGIGIKNLFTFLRENDVDDFHDVTRDLLERWQDSMRERTPPLRAGSRSLYSTAVRRLVEWAADRGIVPLELTRAIKGVRTRHRSDEHERQPISEEDLAKLMAYLGPRRARTTVLDLRDRALFFFLLETGLRVSEALQVTRESYTKGRVRQKGGRFVDFEITPTVAAFIADYLHARHDQLPWLWIKHGNNTNVTGLLEDSGVREIWRRLCYRLNIERFTTHQLRHTSATVLLDEDIDSLAVAKHLHHADLRTVHKYAKVRRRQQQKTLDVLERVIQQGSRIRPEMLARRSPPGGRPRYGRD
jgi:site-specific recombinase XerD